MGVVIEAIDHKDCELEAEQYVGVLLWHESFAQAKNRASHYKNQENEQDTC